MKTYPGLLIAAARRRIKQAVLFRLTQRDLTAQQFWMIVAIHESPGISQTEVASRTRADAPAVSRGLATLSVRKLIRIDTDPGDRRRTRVHLTPAGLRLANELAPVAAEVRSAVVRGMSEAEVEALCTGLKRVIENLDVLESRQEARERA